MASEVGYFLAVFSAPNTLTAFLIEAREGVLFETQYFWSKAFLLASWGMLIASHLIQLSTADEGPDVGPYLNKKIKLGIHMPIALSLRTAFLTLLLFIYHLSPDVPEYFILLVQTGYVIYVSFGRPHKTLLDFSRSLFIEIGLLYILIIRFVEVSTLIKTSRSDNRLFASLAYVEYAIYGVAVVLSVLCLLYHFLKNIWHKNKV